MSFSSDGRRLATGRHDGTASVWDYASDKEVLTFSDQSCWIVAIAFSTDGQQLVTGCRDGAVHSYPDIFDIEGLMALARKRATRSLRSEECRQYMVVEDCPTLP